MFCFYRVVCFDIGNDGAARKNGDGTKHEPPTACFQGSKHILSIGHGWSFGCRVPPGFDRLGIADYLGV